MPVAAKIETLPLDIQNECIQEGFTVKDLVRDYVLRHTDLLKVQHRRDIQAIANRFGLSLDCCYQWRTRFQGQEIPAWGKIARLEATRRGWERSNASFNKMMEISKLWIAGKLCREIFPHLHEMQASSKISQLRSRWGTDRFPYRLEER